MGTCFVRALKRLVKDDTFKKFLELYRQRFPGGEADDKKRREIMLKSNPRFDIFLKNKPFHTVRIFSNFVLFQICLEELDGSAGDRAGGRGGLRRGKNNNFFCWRL